MCPVDWDGEELYRVKRKEDLGQSLIALDITYQDNVSGLEHYDKRNRLLIVWKLEDAAEPRMVVSETDDCTALYVQAPPLGPFDTIYSLLPNAAPPSSTNSSWPVGG